ncbi:hypothetical protein [Rhodococcus erythropolis]
MDPSTPSTPMEYCRLTDSEIGRCITAFEKMEILPGSPITLLDGVSTPRSYRETVSVPIMSALDHLRLVTGSVLGFKGTLPFAHATPLRTALTVASTALWLMDGDNEKRSLRAAMLNYHDHKNYLIYLGLRPAERYPELVEHQAEIGRRRDSFATEALALGVDVTDRHWKMPNDYDMTVAAAKMMDRSMWGDEWMPEVEIPSQWRMLSAYAHGLRWATAPGCVQGEPDLAGLASTTMTFSMDRLMESTSIAKAVVITAMNRYYVLAGHTLLP